MELRRLDRKSVVGVRGAVVVVDVIRAFSTAAAAFLAGAEEIHLVDSVEAALDFKRRRPGAIAIGEDRGRIPDGFDLPNSPAIARATDLHGRVLVQRTSAGTRGAIAARDATRRWAASLMCATATARAVEAADLGTPSYLLTGWFPDEDEVSGEDDRLTAEFIERVRRGETADPAAVAQALRDTPQARRVVLLGPPHVHPDDVEFAADVDACDFAMEIVTDDLGLRLQQVSPD